MKTYSYEKKMHGVCCWVDSHRILVTCKSFRNPTAIIVMVSEQIAGNQWSSLNACNSWQIVSIQWKIVKNTIKP